MYKFSKIGLLVFVAWLTFTTTGSAQEIVPGSAEQAMDILASRGEVNIRFVKPADVSLDVFTDFLSIDNFQGDTLTVYANKSAFIRFLEFNIPYVIILPPSIAEIRSVLGKAASDDWYNHYPTYADYCRLMDDFAADYPHLCRLKETGTSVKGKKLLALKISDNPGMSEIEPVVFLTSTMHGDEPLGYVLMLRLIEHMLLNYDTDDKVRNLVDGVELWINPLSNPDGTYYSSDTTVAGATRYNSNQVDLNRDFPDIRYNFWGTDDRQRETVAMMNFMEEIQPVLSANFHGGAEVVNYPWDTWSRLHADDDWYRQLSRNYADTAQYYGNDGYMTYLDNGITNGYAWYPLYGGRQDYTNLIVHGREVTIELSFTKTPPENTLDYYWHANKNSMLNFIGQALTGVTGTVTDSVTGLPLDAVIRIVNHDFDSSYVVPVDYQAVFYRLTIPGSYHFYISAPGYLSKVVPADVYPDRLTHIDVRLAPTEGRLVYPNPFVDQLQLFIPDASGEITIEFFDITGRKVRQIIHQVIAPGTQTITVNGLTEGIYVLKVTGTGIRFTQQVVKIGE